MAGMQPLHVSLGLTVPGRTTGYRMLWRVQGSSHEGLHNQQQAGTEAASEVSRKAVSAKHWPTTVPTTVINDE